MAYSQAIVQRAMQRLQSENEQNEQSSRARIAAIYEKEPRLGEIERELRRTAAHVLAATFRRQGDPVAAMQQLKKDNLALQQERDWILQAEGLEPDDLTVQPLCPKCGGTGYVGAQMCECLKELCRQEQKKELAALFGSESFDRFRLDLYPAQYDERLKTSPRTLMERTYRDTLGYAQNFTCASPSLLFVGATGLGKTYLSACIARAVADRGYSVSYAPVAELLAAFEADKFRPQPDVSRTADYFSSDLLILDDLGTEMTTQFAVSALYQLLNSRLRQRESLRAELTQLRAKAPQFTQLEAQIEQVEKILRLVRPAEQEWQRQTAHQTSIQEEMTRRRTVQRTWEQEALVLEEQWSAWQAKEPLIAALEEHKRRYEATLPDYDVLAQQDAECAQLEQKKTTLTQALTQLQTELEQLEGETGACSALLIQLDGVEGQLERLRSETQQAERRLAKSKALFEREGQLQQQKSELQARERTYQQALEQWKQARANADQAQAAFLADQAGVLAGQLQDGAPCPVCGSTHHPHPAQPSDQGLSQEETQQLQQQAEEQYQHCTRLATELSTLRGQLQAEQTHLEQESAELLDDTHEAPLSQALERCQQTTAAQLAQLQQAVTETAAQCRQRTQAQETLERLQAQRTELEPLLTQQRAELEDIQRQYSAADARRGETKKRLIFPTRPEVEQAIQAFQQQLDESRKGLEQARQRLDDHRKQMEHNRLLLEAKEAELPQAAELVARSPRSDVAALCSHACEALYGLRCLAPNVQDQGNNHTRFICISRDLEIYPGSDRTSIRLVLDHKPGALSKVLSRLYVRGINVTKLESRPIPDRDFEFQFYFDLETSVYSPEFAQMLCDLEGLCQEFQYLGSYREVV